MINAVSAVRRAPHDGQQARRLQANATRSSLRQASPVTRHKAAGEATAVEEGAEPLGDEARQGGVPIVDLDAGEEWLEVSGD